MLDSTWLAIRNIVTIVLIPGTVAFYVPYLILQPTDVPAIASWHWNQYVASALLLIGVTTLLASIWSFAVVGRGTLAPFDETQKLVVAGLFCCVRNPMYVGVTLILLAQSWFFMSFALLQYAGLFFLLANVMIVGYEENRLRHKYGDEYRRYCQHVGRWIPGRPYYPGEEHSEARMRH